MRHLIELVLEKEGWTVHTASSAESAMDAVKRAACPPFLVICDSASSAESAMDAVKRAACPPFLVICDVLMPNIDGLELMRRMCGRYPSINVIFISGHLSDVSWWPTDLREHRFLAKPFDNAHLVAAVEEVISDGTGPG